MTDKGETGTSAETMGLLAEISQILGTGLTEEQLAISVRLIETGVNPNALANVIKILQQESAAINNPHTLRRGAAGDRT